MPINLDNVVIFSAGGAVGYLARSIIDHFLAKSRTAEDRLFKEFNAAAENFRNVVAPVKHYILNYPLHSLLLKQFPLHKEARIKFGTYLTGSDSIRFEEAWQKYEAKYYDVISIGEKEELLVPNSEIIRSLKQEIPSLIDVLLSFAQSK